MSPVALIVAVAVGVVLLVLLALLWQRRRLAKRFARRISPYAKHEVITGQVRDPEEWSRH